jgi:heme A synthase
VSGAGVSAGHGWTSLAPSGGAGGPRQLPSFWHPKLKGNGIPTGRMQNLPEKRRARLDQSIDGILALIGIQFFLGMWLNLFGSFPRGSNTLASAITFRTDPILIAHIVVGIVLGLGSLALVVRAWSEPVRSVRWLTLAGLVGVLFASITGSGFVTSGYTNNFDSFFMSVGFAIAVTAYYEGLVRLRADRLVRSLHSGPPARA